MTVVALGADVSTKATALVLVGPNGHEGHMLVKHDARNNGARRLMDVRQSVKGALYAARWEPTVAAVELPRFLLRLRGGKVRVSGFDLESCAAVVMEAVQHQWPHLIVMEPTPAVWQSATIGTGRRDVVKPRALAHARANGLDTADDNLADAYCVAEYAREMYLRDVVGVAA